MPSRTTIWFRDAFVIIFALYVVVSIAMVPWSNLKISEPASTTCPTGCSPSINSVSYTHLTLPTTPYV